MLVTLFAITGLPILITGAALVGLPVLLHLIMRQEPKRLPFPAFRFLKQRQQINQRKIRLRHLLLLLLRMALIALICLSLFQPTILSEGFSLRGDRPVAAVIVLDTSPSMGYVLSDRAGLTEPRQRGLKLLEEPAQGPWTCLDEARGRIMEILEELPSASRVAIIDPADRGEPFWSLSLADARQRVRDTKKPRANSQPVTRALEAAYALLARADTELEPGQEPLPRLLAVVSDRTVPSWDAIRMVELQSLRDRVPLPSVYHVYIDVGVDKPVNAAITTVEMKPQIVSANQPVLINVTVEAVGGTADNILLFSVDGDEPQRIPMTPAPDKPVTRQLSQSGLKPGLHQARISLLNSDGMAFDNEHFITFRVREPRRVLALVDFPRESLLIGGMGVRGRSLAAAQTWKESLDAFGWYDCEVLPVDDAVAGKVEWSKYEEVTLLGLTAPPDALWQKVAEYVGQGGQAIVVPGGPTMDAAAYRTDAAAKVLPRKFERWYAVPPKEDATWTWSALSAQWPLLTVFRKYKEEHDFFDKTPPLTLGFWKVEGGARDRMVVAYNDAAEPDLRSPAVLEWGLGPRGKVMQFTVPMAAGFEKIHNYAAEWFYFVLVNEAVKTLTGDSDDQVFNFTAGQNVLMKWPAGDAKPGAIFYLTGPDLTPADSVIKREAGQAFYRHGPEKTGTAGSFTIQSEDGTWRDGFSVNAPAEESNLERLPVEEIEKLFGAGAVSPASKELKLTDILSGKFTQPIELFPFLMILLLMVLAVENLLANKFYRRRRANP